MSREGEAWYRSRSIYTPMIQSYPQVSWTWPILPKGLTDVAPYLDALLHRGWYLQLWYLENLIALVLWYLEESQHFGLVW